MPVAAEKSRAVLPLCAATCQGKGQLLSRPECVTAGAGREVLACALIVWVSDYRGICIVLLDH